MYRPLGNRWPDGEGNDDDATDSSRDIRLTLKHTQPTIEYIHYTLQPGDTLHNISVRFSCSVAAIKRLNNLWSDQDFYAFTKLKLPVGKLRLITDLIEPSSNNQEEVAADGQFDSRSFHPSTASANNVQAGGDQIFKDVDTNIESARRAASSYENHASEIMQSLAQGGNLVADEHDLNKRLLDPNRIAQREAETLLNDMTDYGLSYSGLILFVFIVCLICPLAYVIYLEETHHYETPSNNKHQSNDHQL